MLSNAGSDCGFYYNIAENSREGFGNGQDVTNSGHQTTSDKSKVGVFTCSFKYRLTSRVEFINSRIFFSRLILSTRLYHLVANTISY